MLQPCARIAAIATLLLIPASVRAQSGDSNPGIPPLPLPGWAQAVIGSFDEPLHPKIGGVASGGGIGAGIGYSSPDDQLWFQNASALVTYKGYWTVDGEAGRQSATGRTRVGAFAEIRDMNRLEFYGFGPNSLRQNRSDFRLQETVAGARGWFKPLKDVRVGGMASVYFPDVSSGRNRSVGAVETTFAEVAPAFAMRPRFGRYRAFAELTFPNVERLKGEAYTGVYLLAVEAVRDQGSTHFDFNRWEVETKHVLPGLREGQRLTMHGLVAGTQSGADVPFYMLYTLGGNGGLKAFRSENLGSDGTVATMRSFRNYRFRDRSLLLMQAEYRIPVTNWLHTTVFVDAGQVAPTVSQLFGNIRTGTGFSLSYMHKGRALARVDVGFGSGEGVQMFWSFGNLGI